jgi:DNA-binding HxlR family transcriptional regulator
MARFLDLLGERWTLLVVRELLFVHPEPRRFGELLEALPGISRNLLAARLRSLEAEGIVRSLRPEGGGAATGWGLTGRGAALAPTLRAAAEWSMDNTEDPTGADPAAMRRRISSLG